ncbi:MAG TPA: hypothetical protein VFD70_17935 [Anaerolineae bacterium]|nr:hypothetical protein [Anaerolineae bacterium]
MQVVSKLVKMDFKVGSIEREGDTLIIVSDPNQALKSKVYLTPQDVAGMLRAALNWSVISYVITFPLLYLKSKKSLERTSKHL